MLLLSFISGSKLVLAAQYDTDTNREYQTKAAFLYNFIKFTDWSVTNESNEKKSVADANELLIIGILGQDKFGSAFEPLGNKKIKNRKVRIVRFQSFDQLKIKNRNTKTESMDISDLSKCHLIFISGSEKKNLKQIISSLKPYSVLTVADMDGFIKAGGMIKFTNDEQKLCFEINLIAARNSKLKISSKLLQLAKRVVD